MKKDVKPSYYTKAHRWAQKNLKHIKKCEKCSSRKQIECANISGKYFLLLSDWKRLCKKCHYAYDYIAERGKKISASLTGRKLSSEHKKSIGLGVKGKKNGFYGQKHTAETRKRMSESRRRYFANKK